LGAAVFVAGCDKFQEPDAMDPAPIVGCYTAQNAPSLNIGLSALKIEGAGRPVPFRYEFRKVGAVIRAPIDSTEAGGKLNFKPSDEHMFRVFHTHAGPVIRATFGRQGIVVDYVRQPSGRCSA
jgi:hypothetical protein